MAIFSTNITEVHQLLEGYLFFCIPISSIHVSMREVEETQYSIVTTIGSNLDQNLYSFQKIQDAEDHIYNVVTSENNLPRHTQFVIILKLPDQTPLQLQIKFRDIGIHTPAFEEKKIIHKAALSLLINWVYYSIAYNNMNLIPSLIENHIIHNIWFHHIILRDTSEVYRVIIFAN